MFYFSRIFPLHSIGNTLDYYTGNSVIIGLGDEKVADVFDMLLRHIQIKG